jgi:hypothetical protein
MVNGEQSESERMIRLSFTVYCLPHALRSALGALRQRAVQRRILSGSNSLLFCAAMRTVIEIPLKSLAATMAADCLQIRSDRKNLAGFVGDMTASLTFDKSLALANTKNG